MQAQTPDFQPLSLISLIMAIIGSGATRGKEQTSGNFPKRNRRWKALFVLYEKNEFWYLLSWQFCVEVTLFGELHHPGFKGSNPTTLNDLFCRTWNPRYLDSILSSKLITTFPWKNPHLSWYILSTRWIFHDYFAYFPWIFPILNLAHHFTFTEICFFPPPKKDSAGAFPNKKHSQLPIFRRAKVRSLRQSVLNPNKSTSNLTNLRRWPWWSSCASEEPHENLRGRFKTSPNCQGVFFLRDSVNYGGWNLRNYYLILWVFK